MPPEGLCPKIPQYMEGIRMLPPTSEPTAKGQKPAAMEAPMPPEEPPGVRLISYGLYVHPYTLLYNLLCMYMSYQKISSHFHDIL